MKWIRSLVTKKAKQRLEYHPETTLKWFVRHYGLSAGIYGIILEARRADTDQKIFHLSCNCHLALREAIASYLVDMLPALTKQLGYRYWRRGTQATKAIDNDN